jgi:hypothetical protein
MIHQNVYDAMLQYIIDNTTALYICEQEPEDLDTLYAVGLKAAPTIDGPSTENDNRIISIESFIDGVITSSGIARYFALVSSTEVLVSYYLKQVMEVTSGDTFIFDRTLILL